MHNTTLNLDRCVRRGTHLCKGRSRSLDPATSAARQLHYGRVILAAGDAPLRFASGGLETGLIALGGRAEVKTGGRSFTLAPYDALYVPRDSELEIRALGAGCDLAEIAAPVERSYPLQFVAWDAVQKDP